MARTRKKYTDEFKREAVRLVTEQNMTYTEVGSDLGVDKSTIRDWCQQAAGGQTDATKGVTGAGSTVEEELLRLRRENQNPLG